MSDLENPSDVADARFSSRDQTSSSAVDVELYPMPGQTDAGSEWSLASAVGLEQATEAAERRTDSDADDNPFHDMGLSLNANPE